MWDISKEIITFFKLPDKYLIETDSLKYFTDLKAKLQDLPDEFELTDLVDIEEYKFLASKSLSTINKNKEIAEKEMNFEIFKLLFDLALTEDISPIKSTFLLDLARKYHSNSSEVSKNIFPEIIEKYLLLIESTKNMFGQRDQCLSKLVVSTKNLGITVPLSLGPSLFKNHLNKLSTQRESLIALVII